jgi:hypothetical protein
METNEFESYFIERENNNQYLLLIANSYYTPYLRVKEYIENLRTMVRFGKSIPSKPKMASSKVSPKNGISPKSHTSRNKWIIFLIVFMFIGSNIKAQKYTVELIEDATYNLLGNAHFWGEENKRRAVVRVKLPNDAIKWGYVFITGKNRFKNVINLDIKSGLLDISSAFLEGTDNCKIYVMDKDSSEKFKKDGKDFFYLENSSIIEAVSEGKKVPVPRELETIYIGIENANVGQSLDVHIEVFAVYGEQ